MPHGVRNATYWRNKALVLGQSRAWMEQQREQEDLTKICGIIPIPISRDKSCSIQLCENYQT